jgi:predicted transcriptional regulator YheO
MAEVVVDLVLEQGRHWDPERRCWCLPAPLGGLVGSVTLDIYGETLPADKVGLHRGCICLLDATQKIGPNTDAVAHLRLRKPRPAALKAAGYLASAAVAALAVYLLFVPRQEPDTRLVGKPLAAYEFYPVVADPDGEIRLDVPKFMQAVRHLSENSDPQATSELVYLGQNNGVSRLLTGEEAGLYRALIDKSPIAENRYLAERRRQLLANAASIVEGVGDTFRDTPIEIVLHDTTNPLKSVRAIRNPVSRRKVDDPTTNLGIELIKTYARVNRDGTSYISYALPLKDGRTIKSSTIPLYDERLGLYGFVCMNIDTSKVSCKEANGATAHFLEAFCTTRESHQISEIIENTKHRPPQNAALSDVWKN